MIGKRLVMRLSSDVPTSRPNWRLRDWSAKGFVKRPEKKPKSEPSNVNKSWSNLDLSVRLKPLLPKRKLRPADSSMKDLLKRLALKEREEWQRLWLKLRPEDLPMRLKLKDKEKKRRPGTLPGVSNKRTSELKPRLPSSRDKLKPPLLDKLGSLTKKDSPLKERLQLKLLDSNKPGVKKKPDLLLRLNARREKPNLKPGESKEKRRSRLEELRPKDSDKRLSPRLKPTDRQESSELLNLPLKLRLVARPRQIDKLLPVLNGRLRSRPLDLRLKREKGRFKPNVRGESPSTKLSKRDSVLRPSLELKPKRLPELLDWLNSKRRPS